MQVIEDLLSSGWMLAASVAGIGTFDGVHLAHQTLIRQLAGRARELELPSVVLTFEPLPQEVLQPGYGGRLCSPAAKLELIEALGASHVCVIRFDREFSRTEPGLFIDQVLGQRLGAREVFVGFNFAFGHQARGNPELLEAYGEHHGFRTRVLPPVKLGDEVVSSTSIRGLLGSGDVEGAGRLLDRPYELEGRVVRGDGRGRALGFPTANLAVVPENAAVPRRGVYAGTTRLLSGRTAGVEQRCAINVGVGPTFGGSREKVEVHLLDFDGDLLGQDLRVSFRRRLRSERSFASQEELAAQIAADIERCVAAGVAGTRLPEARA